MDPKLPILPRTICSCKWNPVFNTKCCVWSPTGISAKSPPVPHSWLPMRISHITCVISNGKINVYADDIVLYQMVRSPIDDIYSAARWRLRLCLGSPKPSTPPHLEMLSTVLEKTYSNLLHPCLAMTLSCTMLNNLNTSGSPSLIQLGLHRSTLFAWKLGGSLACSTVSSIAMLIYHHFENLSDHSAAPPGIC